MEENSQKSKKTVYYSGFTVALITALVGAYVLFYITISNRSVCFIRPNIS